MAEGVGAAEGHVRGARLKPEDDRRSPLMRHALAPQIIDDDATTELIWLACEHTADWGRAAKAGGGQKMGSETIIEFEYRV